MTLCRLGAVKQKWSPDFGSSGTGLLRLEDPEARGLLAVAERRLVGAETRKSKRLQRRVVKRLGLRDVANADRHVIEHGWFLLMRAATTAGRPSSSRWTLGSLAFHGLGKIASFRPMQGEPQSVGPRTPAPPDGALAKRRLAARRRLERARGRVPRRTVRSAVRGAARRVQRLGRRRRKLHLSLGRRPRAALSGQLAARKQWLVF